MSVWAVPDGLSNWQALKTVQFLELPFGELEVTGAEVSVFDINAKLIII